MGAKTVGPSGFDPDSAALQAAAITRFARDPFATVAAEGIDPSFPD